MSSPSEILSQFNLNNAAKSLSKPVPPVLNNTNLQKKSAISIKQVGFVIVVILLLGGGGYCLFKLYKKIKEKHAKEIHTLKVSNESFAKNIQSLKKQLNETIAEKKKIEKSKPSENNVEEAKHTPDTVNENEKFTLLDQLV